MTDPATRMIGARFAGEPSEENASASTETVPDADRRSRLSANTRFRGSRTSRTRWQGLPQRRSRALPLLLAAAIALAVAAGALAERFVSPTQIAASARPPAPSLITASVRHGVLPVIVQVRAAVSTGKVVTVGAPTDLSGSLPVVTSVSVSAGQRITAGTLLVTVAERPVFVFAGLIPAFRTMSPGTHGPDVEELQNGLTAIGYETGADAVGVYGPGTAAAVAALYKANGVSPVMSSESTRTAALSRQVTNARAAVSAARAKLSADRQSKAPRAVLATDRANLAAARTALAATERSLAAAEQLAGATVPLGEVVFIPRLPARVVSAAKLGSTVGADSSGSAVAQLETGKTALVGTVSHAQDSSMRAGMKGIAVSDASGAQFTVRVSAVRGSRMTFLPVGHVPGGINGQSVLVTMTTSRAIGLIVPVAAVSTSGSGQTFVTVSRPGGTDVVIVRLGLASGGQQVVAPVRRGALRPGDLVVLGTDVAGGR